MIIGKVYKVIDKIESSSLKNRLDNIKNNIYNDNNAKIAINNFNKAKEMYEKYNIKDDFIKAKTELFKNELINEYLNIQNEINKLSIKINNNIKNITDDISCNK